MGNPLHLSLDGLEFDKKEVVKFNEPNSISKDVLRDK
jgi:hypothetical protein